MAQAAASEGLDGRPALGRPPARVKSIGPESSSVVATSTGGGSGPTTTGGKNDVDQLQDIFGMSGVNLRDEEEAIHRPALAASGGTMTAGVSIAEARRRDAEAAQPTAFFLDVYALSHRIHKIAQRNGLGVDADVLSLLSTAAHVRSRNLLTSMVTASRHRRWSSHLREPPAYVGSGEPMYHEEVHDDPQKLLSALARVEKAEEQEARQLRMQRDLQDEQAVDEDGAAATTNGATDAPASASAGNAAAQEDAKRKAKRPGGASAAARNMTEDKRLKLANKTAAQALGISAGSKAWMFGGGDSLTGSGNSASGGRQETGSRLPKPRFAPPPTALKPINTAHGKLSRGSTMDGTSDDGTGEDTPSAINPGGWGDLAARQRHKEEEERKRTQRVNLEDALHALDMERKGGAGRGSGDRVLYTARALGRPTLPSTSGLTSIG